jgi:hypothetical protein
MEDLILTVPALYGDHHTLEVRSILQGIKGVSVKYVSPAAHHIALGYEPSETSPQAIEQALAQRGYLPGAPETAYPSSPAERATRHSAAYSGTGEALAFSETAPQWLNRPLWPCPGLEPIRIVED